MWLGHLESVKNPENPLQQRPLAGNEQGAKSVKQPRGSLAKFKA